MAHVKWAHLLESLSKTLHSVKIYIAAAESKDVWKGCKKPNISGVARMAVSLEATGVASITSMTPNKITFTSTARRNPVS